MSRHGYSSVTRCQQKPVMLRCDGGAGNRSPSPYASRAGDGQPPDSLASWGKAETHQRLLKSAVPNTQALPIGGAFSFARQRSERLSGNLDGEVQRVKHHATVAPAHLGNWCAEKGTRTRPAQSFYASVQIAHESPETRTILRNGKTQPIPCLIAFYAKNVGITHYPLQ